VICTDVWFLQTYSPLRWSQRPDLFQPFPSLKRSPRPSELLFSITWDTKSPQGPPHNWCLFPCLQLSWEQETNKKKSDPSERTQMNTNVTSHYLIGMNFRLGRGFDLFVCVLEWSLDILYWMQWLKLGCLEVLVVGVFIAPTTKVAVGRGCCRRAHRTVRCASHVTQPLGFDRWSSDMWGHRTVRWCTGQSLFTVWCAFWCLLWLLRAYARTVYFHCSFADDRWREVAIAPLAHRTVRCYIGQSGEL
jgi:hypothetical protein